MNRPAQQIRSYIIEDVWSNRREISKLFDDFPSNEAVNILVEACHDLHAEILGWAVFPILMKHMIKRKDVYQEMMKVISNTDVNKDFRLVLMDFIDTASRKNKESSYGETLYELCDERQDVHIRAAAGRHIARIYNDNTIKIIRNYLRSNNQLLVDTAAHIIRHWILNGIQLPRDVIFALIDYTTSFPDRVVRSSSVIRTLAHIESRSAKSALLKLNEYIQSDTERACYINAAFDVLNTRILSNLIKETMNGNSPKCDRILQGIFTSQPDHLNRLYKSGFLEAFLYGCDLVSGIINSKHTMKLLRELADNKRRKLSKRGERLLDRLMSRWTLKDVANDSKKSYKRESKVKTITSSAKRPSVEDRKAQ